MRYSLFLIFLTPLLAQNPPVTASTYLGGRELDTVKAVTLDRQGNILLAGYTQSQNFPVLNAAQATCTLSSRGSCYDAFVMKLSPDARQILWSTFLGDSGNDEARGIATDTEGNVYVTGILNDGVLVAKYAPDGRAIFRQSIGGPPLTAGNAIAVDAANNIYLTGETSSRSFPITNPIVGQGTPGEDSCTAIGGGSFPIDAFLIRLDSQGLFLYSTFLRGNGNDRGTGIAIDPETGIYVSGTTSSRDFPIFRALQPGYNGGDTSRPGTCTGGDVFVTKIALDSPRIIYSTYYGGSGLDEPHALAVDVYGNAVVTGSTTSTNLRLNRPVNGTPGPGFITRINATGTEIPVATYLSTATNGLAIDRAGRTWVAGTRLYRLDPNWSSIQVDQAIPGMTMALGQSQNAVLAVGYTRSLTPVNPIQATPQGFDDGFLTRWDEQLTTNSQAVVVTSSNYRGPRVSRSSLVSLFRPGLTTETIAAPSIPLPFALGGVEVRIRDFLNIEYPAPLHFVSPGQINFILPDRLLEGLLQINVLRDGQTVATAVADLARTTPGIYTADSTGTGVAAASVTRVFWQGGRIDFLAFNCTTSGCAPVTIEMGHPSDRVYVTLYGSGFRNAERVTAMLGSEMVDLLYAGAQSEFPGLDQINIEVPRSMVGRGRVPFFIIADGIASNSVDLVFQ